MSDPTTRTSEQLREDILPATPWQTIVWDDPVNLMSYVTYVFRKHFGYGLEKSEALMFEVHNEGSAVVAEGSREEMELHVEALHGYGLWATVREGHLP